MSQHGQCEARLTLRTEQTLYCIEDEGHGGPHRFDDLIWKYIDPRNWDEKVGSTP